MTTCLSLLLEKKKVLEACLGETGKDMEEVDNALHILSENQGRLETLKGIQMKLSLLKEGDSPVEETLRRDILSLLQQLKVKTEAQRETIKRARKSAEASIRGMSRAKQVATSYVRTEQGPVFVDKDFG